ncbi:AraC family transcriptional regulator [Kribbella sp. NBC_00709]|uniref:AraC family transcriptional regulator n=1 Tax=Kribbella sp. NBC_00709 TaxID=2975972 RepID=UPI002E2AA139|nr:AraC family transcriptional regulator [Kribbella sp. NBC_00709]
MLALDGYLVAPLRSRFSLAVDTYDTWCLLLPIAGSFDYEVGDAHGTAKFGDVVVCPPGGTLRRRMRTRTSFFHARFTTSLEPRPGCTRLRDLDRLRGNLALLENANTAIATHVVTDLVLMLRRARSPQDRLVHSAMTYLLEHYASPELSLSELASALGISPPQLSRRFRDVRGVTPVAYLRDLRLQKARELLTESDDTLQVIAEHTGYRSAFYLSRVFSAQTGQSPSEYRRTSRV